MMFQRIEQEICVIASRLRMDPVTGDRFNEILARGPDWGAVLELAGRLGVKPLLYHHVGNVHHPDHIPGEVRESLKQAYRLQSIRNLRFYGLLKKLLAALREAGIPVILLKGAFCARWVYGDIGLRPMSDLDILVHSEDRHRAQDCLQSLGLGYLQPGNPYHSILHEEIMLAHGSHLPPLYENRICRVEVHTSLFKGRQNTDAAMEALWVGAQEWDWDGLAVRALAPEDQILHLCSHLYQHLLAHVVAFYWFADVHETVVRWGKSMDWEGVRRRSLELGQTAALETVLGLLERHWKTPLPAPSPRSAPSGERELSHALPGIELEDVFRRLNCSEAENYWSAVPAGYLNLLSYPRDIPGWRNRVRYVWKLFFPERDHMVHRYQPGNSLALLGWYCIHPVTRITNFCRGLLVVGFSRLTRRFSRDARDSRGDTGTQRL
jgi:sugar phosphate isomerase/epimerase